MGEVFFENLVRALLKTTDRTQLFGRPEGYNYPITSVKELSKGELPPARDERDLKVEDIELRSVMQHDLIVKDIVGEKREHVKAHYAELETLEHSLSGAIVHQMGGLTYELERKVAEKEKELTDLEQDIRDSETNLRSVLREVIRVTRDGCLLGQ